MSCSNSNLSYSYLSRFIYNRKPHFYGGEQEEYEALARQAIDLATKTIQEGSARATDLTELFFTVFGQLQESRQEIAQKHTPEEAYQFGLRRDRSVGPEEKIPPFCNFVTQLLPPYESYNELVTAQFQMALQAYMQMHTSLPAGSLFRFEGGCNGRKMSYEITLYDESEIRRLGWNRDVKEIQYEGKAIAEFVRDFDTMKRFKAAQPEQYRRFVMTPMISRLNEFRVTREEDEKYLVKKVYVLGTLRIQVNDKLYAATRACTWLYANSQEAIDEMEKYSVTILTHQDAFLIEDTLQEISKLFKEAIEWKTNEGLEALKTKVALFRFYYAACTPIGRGDGAVGDWLEKTIYSYHGYETKYNDAKLPYFEPLCLGDFQGYREMYDQIIDISEALS